MGITAAIIGGIGGLCAVLGIIDALKIAVPFMNAELAWPFWFGLATILLLASIAFAQGRGGGID